MDVLEATVGVLSKIDGVFLEETPMVFHYIQETFRYAEEYTERLKQELKKYIVVYKVFHLHLPSKPAKKSPVSLLGKLSLERSDSKMQKNL